MPCQGQTGDYLCQGWRDRTARIRERDGGRCRGCNRNEEDVRLEVHHRVYGASGPCGECVLTDVADDDLTTLCRDCHDSITDVRRRIRYGAETIEATLTPEPEAVRTIVRVETVVTTILAPPAPRRGITVQRYNADIR